MNRIFDEDVVGLGREGRRGELLFSIVLCNKWKTRGEGRREADGMRW
jgi:hypothetical protein